MNDKIYKLQAYRALLESINSLDDDIRCKRNKLLVYFRVIENMNLAKSLKLVNEIYPLKSKL